MVFTKKSQLFWQGFPRLILVVTFIITYLTSDCFAGAAKVLSDEELDNVQAEGLYFDFDVSFGSLNDLVGSQDIKLFNIPAANLNLSNKKEDAVIPADVMDKIKLLIAPYMVNNITVTSNTPSNNTANPTDSGAGTPLLSAPLTTAAVPLDTAPAPSVISQSPASETVSTSVPGITTIAQPENVSISTAVPLNITGNSQASSTSTPLNTPGAAASQPSAANNILPAASTSVTQPNNSSSDILRLDITAGGKDNTALTAASLMPTSMLPLTANNGSNIVNVSDSSQQYLSSLVNVNAAGSIVPVMLNITVNINSNIGTISNNNTLDLRNYYRFQLH